MADTHKTEREDRIDRLKKLKEQGIDPYPARLDQKITPVSNLLKEHESLEKKSSEISIAGRIVSKRLHGTLLFADVKDATGKIQLYIKKGDLADDAFVTFSELLDIGDFILATGVCTTTKRGEKSLLVTSFQLLTKALRPLPEKWHGLQDVETRFRKRELDLLANDEVKHIFTVRSNFIKSIRHFLERQGFLEVETPILQLIPGGATAQPFVTHHNALNQDMYLRVAPELYLKRLIVGGFEKVFEVARCFRNEGIDSQHNPEFTQVELYAAYYDFTALMVFTEQMLQETITNTLGTLTVAYQGKTIDFSGTYPRKSFQELLQEYLHMDVFSMSAPSDIAQLAKKHGVQVEKEWGRGKLIDELYKKVVRPHIIQPLFLTHHPVELSPLAKKDATSLDRVERFQLVAHGMELVNAFSELNDPIDQKERFLEQEKLRVAGDTEAQFKDDMYVESLEYGLPPTGGLGLGIDRFVTLLTNTHNLKEVILFPTLRGKE